MRTYDLQASPRVYPGQIVTARVVADQTNTAAVSASLRIKAYGQDDRLVDFDGPSADLAPGAEDVLKWTLPDLDGQPIQRIGIALTSHGARADGTVWLDYLRWDGAPKLELRRPRQSGTFWRRSWVNNVSFFSNTFAPAFRISQDRGSGIIIHGTREWRDYRVSSIVAVHLGSSAGLAARVQGLRRYYALLLEGGDMVRVVKVRDDVRTILAETPYRWALEEGVGLMLELRGREIVAAVGTATVLRVTDDSDTFFENGGIGLVITEGALSTNQVGVEPLVDAALPSSKRLELTDA
jgi:hypothetical protein